MDVLYFLFCFIFPPSGAESYHQQHYLLIRGRCNFAACVLATVEHSGAVSAGVTRGVLHAHVFDAHVRFDTGRGRTGFVAWGSGCAHGSGGGEERGGGGQRRRMEPRHGLRSCASFCGVFLRVFTQIRARSYTAQVNKHISLRGRASSGRSSDQHGVGPSDTPWGDLVYPSTPYLLYQSRCMR